MTDDAGRHDGLTIGGLLGDFRLLIYLFLGFRLIMALVYQPYLFETFNEDGTPRDIERGMSTFGDLQYYYSFARLTDDGFLPYRDFWYEFPPVSFVLFGGVYQLGNVRGAMDYTLWATAIGLLMTLCDVGNLALLRRLATRLHGRRTATALVWIYAVLAAPVIFPWWTFETLVLFSILLALVWLFEGRDAPSAVTVAVGTLTKYVPLLLLPTLWRFYDRRRALRYTIISVGIVALVFGGMLAWGGKMAQASLLAQFNKSSYQSVWALIDGNLITGSFAGPAVRFDADTAYDLLGKSSIIPWWLRLIPFAGLGLYLFTRKLRRDERGVLAFFTVTLLLFFLWAQGWSPQWVLTLTPVLLLNFPDRNGVLLVLVLSLMSFVEYPVLFMRTGSTGGEIAGNLVPTFVTLVLVRTALLAGIVAALWSTLTQGEGHERA
jgi:hypothetical protein